LLSKVADFGLARSFEGDGSMAVTGAAAILGTPAYMSPEQIQGQKVDGRTDLYTLAVMFWQMLTGELPYQRDTVQAMLIVHLLEEPPPLPADLARVVPPLMERELHKALAKRPEDRHSDIARFATALDDSSGRRRAKASAASVDCPACGLQAPAGGFCGNCGGAVPLLRCAACGVARVGERYACDACGASLLSWTASAGAFVGALRASQAAVLVARLPFAEEQALAEAAAAFATAVAREGGRTLAVCGGEAVAASGLGGFRDGDVERAVDAALAFVSRAGCASVRAAVELGAVASQGTAVGWGPALCGGEAVERARKAVGDARPGAVVVGGKAYRDVRGVFEVRSEPGRSGFPVLRRRDASLALSDYMSRDVAQPFVGRSAELTLALKAARRVRRDASGMAIALVGAAEVGKSRLVGELLRTLEESGEPWRIELVRCSPLELATGWQPFAALVRDAMVSDGGSDGEVALRLSRLPGMQDGDPERGLRRIQALVRMLGLDRGGEAQSAPRPASDAEVAAALEAWAAVVRGLCTQQAVALVVEDLQYARPVLLQLLARVVAVCEDVPLCLVLPLRADRAEAVLDALHLPPARTVRVELDPLEAADSQALLRELLDGLDPPPQLGNELHAFSDGLPGRVAQAVDMLIDEGALAFGEDGWRLDTGKDMAGLLRTSLDELLLRRVGRLAPADRALLEAIAVAGGSAAHGLLAALLQRELLPADTDRLRQMGLLAESRTQPFAGMREWQLRPTALVPLLLQAMPRAAGDRPDLALLRVRARRLRGQLLDALGQPEDALHALRSAVEDARRLDAGFDTSVYAVSLIAMVLLRQARADEAEAIAARALDECRGQVLEGHPDLASGVGRLHTWLGHAAARRGDHATAESHYRAGQDAFQRAGDDVAAAMAELSLGNLAWRAGRLADAEAVYRRVCQRCLSLDAAIFAATAQVNLGNVLIDQGKAAAALDLLRESERTQRHMGRLEVLAETLRLQALALRALGMPDAARTAAHAALDHGEKTGQTGAVAAVRETLAGLRKP
jgi:tetratricopeptide (TPR) repeat protein/predicted RNA-binding Zn-ribbon protein involved in translation (DUF1610 family)